MGIIAFKKVKDAYGWMSNMSPHPIHGYRTAEAAFQALRFADQSIRDLIKAEKSPMGAKMMAKKHADKMVIKPRSEPDLMLMSGIICTKVLAYPELKKELLATGDAEIIEDVTGRPNESGLFWGAALMPDARDGHDWVGENNLGKIWMYWRTKLAA
jgi:predicted NAD-dependent protein-ADP-ribosyltransferase YbiA (DUF1768 family)